MAKAPTRDKSVRKKPPAKPKSTPSGSAIKAGQKRVATSKPVGSKKEEAKKKAVKPPIKSNAKKPTTKPTPRKKATATKSTPKQATPKQAAPKKAVPKKTTSLKSKPKTKPVPQPASAATGRVPLSDPGPAEVLGRITWLMLQCDAHKHMFIADLEWRVLPPVLLKQFRLFRKDGNPIGYAAWAFLDGETDKRLRKGDVKLAPDQWRAGPHLWLLDLIAPFGGQDVMLKEIDAKLLKGRSATLRLPNEAGTGFQIIEVGSKSKPTSTSINTKASAAKN